MKARKKGSNDEWKDVIYAQLEGSDILYKGRYLEFDTLSTEIKTNEQIADEKHWQDVRERAAIAALQGLLSNRIYGNNVAREAAENDTEIIDEIVADSVDIADALVKQLKRE